MPGWPPARGPDPERKITQATDVLAAFLKAYEAKDINAIALMLADDVHLQDWNLTAQGKPAVLAETRKISSMHNSCRSRSGSFTAQNAARPRNCASPSTARSSLKSSTRLC